MSNKLLIILAGNDFDTIISIISVTIIKFLAIFRLLMILLPRLSLLSEYRYRYEICVSRCDSWVLPVVRSIATQYYLIGGRRCAVGGWTH
jgi:hypothetical protein